MKKGNSVVAGLIAVAFLFGAQTVFAAPGDGAYVGVFAGQGMSQVSGKTTTLAKNTHHQAGTFELAEGGLSMDGIQFGGLLGFGLRMGSLYAGIEGEYVGSEEEFELKSSTTVELEEGRTITSIKASKNWSAGPAVRLGFYANESTLFALRVGFVATEFEVDAGYAKSTYTGGGMRYGGSLETAVSGDLSLRMEYVVTDYVRVPVSGIGSDVIDNDNSDADSEITGLDAAGRVAIVYTF